VSPPFLDVDRILRHTFVAQVQHYLTLGSTNDCAKTMAQGQPGRLPLLIVAEEQTAGRGRGGNRWWTGRGSLAFSLLLDTSELRTVHAHRPLISLVAGVAIVEAVAPLVPGRAVGIHWPNDVYTDGRKLAGILVELLSARQCVLGIGVNTNNSLRDAPRELRESATTLLELSGTTHDPTEILVRILSALAGLLAQLAHEPEAVAARANGVCLQYGRRLTVRQGHRSITGRCIGIDADGGLLLETSGGPQKVYSGTLHSDDPQ
jgi:BirA family biotin operon repressor/biotin-[acetyl-CoA-carboxylase] ligase